MRPSRGSYSLAQADTRCSGTLSLTQNGHATPLNLSNIPITTCLHHYVGHYCSQTEKRLQARKPQGAGVWQRGRICAVRRRRLALEQEQKIYRTPKSVPPKNVSSLQGTHLGYRNPGIPTEARGDGGDAGNRTPVRQQCNRTSPGAVC